LLLPLFFVQPSPQCYTSALYHSI